MPSFRALPTSLRPAVRPKPGDLLVREGDETRTPLTPADIVADGKPTLAWAMDAEARIVRNGSRFNKLVLVRMGAGDDAVFANTVICTHDGCDVTDWLGDEHALSCPCHYSKFDPKDGGRVISGPAPRALPSLPLTVTGGRLDAAILRQLLIALAMIIVMLLRPRGLWPTPEHGKSLQRNGGAKKEGAA